MAYSETFLRNLTFGPNMKVEENVETVSKPQESIQNTVPNERYEFLNSNQLKNCFLFALLKIHRKTSKSFATRHALNKYTSFVLLSKNLDPVGTDPTICMYVLVNKV